LIGNASGGLLVKWKFTSRAEHRKVLRPGLFYRRTAVEKGASIGSRVGFETAASHPA